MARVLVIEDDETLLAVLRMHLEDMDHDVHLATNSNSALDVARAHVLDLVLSDIRIEGARDGLSTLEDIKSLQPEVKTIVMTGFAIDDAPLRAVKIKVDEYLYKPFGEAELQRCLENQFKSGERRRTLENVMTTFQAYSLQTTGIWDSILRDTASQEVVRQRDRFFQAYYTLIRARKLTLEAALDCWDELEPIERGFARYQAQARRFTPSEVHKGAQAYARVSEKAWQLAAGTPPPQRTRQFPEQAFAELYQRLQKSELSLEELRLALPLWFARRGPQGPSAKALVDKVWGQFARGD